MAIPAYLRAFREFIGSSPGFNDLPAMEREFYAASDRAAVILQASNVENILTAALVAKMRPSLPNNFKDRLFEGNGPLHNFSAKINIGYAFELFGPVFKHDLDLIRELRNGFAHIRHPMTLSTPQVAALCAQLKLPNSPGKIGPHAYYEHFPDLAIVADQNHLRTRFTVACHTISVRLLELEPALLGRFPYTVP